MSGAMKKNIRLYSEEYLKFGFIPAVHDERIPFCLLCQQCLSNESMKRGRSETFLKAKPSAHISSDLKYFENLKKNFETRPSLIILKIINVFLRLNLEKKSYHRRDQ